MSPITCPGLLRTLKWFDGFYHPILTIVQVLLALTADGKSNDSYIAFAVPCRRNADGKDRTLYISFDRFEGNVSFSRLTGW